MRYIAFDTESKNGRLLELSAYEFNEKGEYIRPFHILISPGMPRAQTLAEIPSATYDTINVSASTVQALNAFKKFVGDDGILVGQGGASDIHLLSRLDPEFAQKFAYDTAQIARVMYPNDGGWILRELVRRHGDASWHERPHSAWSDAWATGKMFFALQRQAERMAPQDLRLLRMRHPAPTMLGKFFHDVVRGNGLATPARRRPDIGGLAA